MSLSSKAIRSLSRRSAARAFNSSASMGRSVTRMLSNSKNFNSQNFIFMTSNVRSCSSSLTPHQLSQSRNYNAMTAKDIPPKIKESEYAVRGEIVLLAQEMEKDLKQHGLEKLIPCNIGNPQAVGQKPITFHRQLLSILSNPHLDLSAGSADVENLSKIYPSDVIDRAREYSNNFGAYSHSKGGNIFRQKIADFIYERDSGCANNKKVDIENIFITDGASPAIKTVLELLISNEDDEVLIPIPQYPLYSASVTRLGGKWVGYEMQEDYSAANPSWGLDINVLEQKMASGKCKAVVVINPGNPIGSVLSKQNLVDLVKLCEKNSVPILADEVYQANIYTEKKFTSMREVVLELNSPVECYSFQSISKGYYGECGLRGGYMELLNINTEINEEIYKLMSMCLCSNTLAQAMAASIMNPPRPGEPSAELFEKERGAILDALKSKAIMVHEELNKIKGVDCMPIEGAMYAFPKVDLPQKYVEHAKSLGKEPDTLYCIEVLKKLGVILVPGNGFGQRAGTYHYRMTILPQEADLKKMLVGLKDFQEDLYAKYG